MLVIQQFECRHHKQSTMTIDTFGRHIHKHIIKRHLEDENVIQDFLKHPKVEEIVASHIQKHTISTVNVPLKYVMKLESDGTLNPPGNYLLSGYGGPAYRNVLYTGSVVKVHYPPVPVQLCIDGTDVIRNRPIPIKKGSVLTLKYIGPTPIPKQTAEVYAEIIIEGNVIN